VFQAACALVALTACLSAAPNAWAVSDVYAIDLRAAPNRLLKFPVNAPANTAISTDAGFNGFAMDFNSAASILYGITEADHQFGTISTTTGDFTLIAPVSGPAASVDIFTGLSVDPTSETFYLSASTNLYTIDPASGTTLLVGAFNISGSLMIDIAIDRNGQMYAHDIVTDSLYSVDKATGQATLIGPTGFATNFAQGMDFDFDTNTLYATFYTGGGTGAFVSLDLLTGAATTIVSTNSWNSEMEMAVASPFSAVPEPAYLPFLALGLAALLVRRKRSRATPSASPTRASVAVR
jgi:uncharacterized protein (TIGR03382 family)